MKSKKKWLVLMILAAGIAIFSYRFAKDEPRANETLAETATVPPPVASAATDAADTAKTEAMAAPSAPNVSGADAPINARPGYGKDSYDLILAMVRHPELQLTKDEMEKLLTVYLDAVKRRSDYEVSIAKVDVVSPLERNLIIPPYQQEGLKMEAQMYEDFASVVGAKRSAQVREALRSELYIRNFGFGESEQKINVKVAAIAIPETHYEITHSVAELHTTVRDSSGNVRDTTLTVKGSRSIIPISDLSAYDSLLELFPVGDKS